MVDEHAKFKLMITPGPNVHHIHLELNHRCNQTYFNSVDGRTWLARSETWITDWQNNNNGDEFKHI